MINEERTFEEFGYVSGDLKHYSNRKVWAICEVCGKEWSIIYYNYSKGYKLCKSCIQKYKKRIQRGPFTIDYFNRIQESIDEGKIDELRTFEEFGYYSVDLKDHSNRHVYFICRICKLNRKVGYNKCNYGAALCKSCSDVNINHHLRELDNPVDMITGTHINEYFTFKLYGYYSIELSNGSQKPVIATCKVCGIERKVTYLNHIATKDMCHKCASRTIERREQLRKDNIGKHGGKLNGMYGRRGKDAPNYGRKASLECRKRISARLQSIPYNEWTGFATEQKYCVMFNNEIREKIRNKYDRKCFICNKLEKENIPISNNTYRKLSVHHVDMNKNQGCNDSDWVLIPVCMECHNRVHNLKMESYITYIIKLEKSEEGYNY